MCSKVRNQCVAGCCCCSDEASDVENEQTCSIACCLDDEEEKSNKCVTLHHSCLGYIFPRLLSKIVDKTDRKAVLLIAGRRVPKTSCYRLQVYTYLTLMAIVTGLWFVVTLLEQAIYHSATTCNEIKADDRYYVCFNHSTNFTIDIVDCHTLSVANYSASHSIQCYTYSITPSAFAVAFSMASFISTIFSVTFHSAIYCSDERCSRRGLVIIQFMFFLAIICCAVSFGMLYTTDERMSLTNYFLDEKAPLRSVIFALLGVSLLLGSCLPWAPFKTKRKYETLAIEHP